MKKIHKRSNGKNKKLKINELIKKINNILNMLNLTVINTAKKCYNKSEILNALLSVIK